jgi:beta-lactam-binding protein with PASTA domain
MTYEGCQVPRLKGKKLKALKKSLRSANCKLGPIKKRGTATAKSGKVVKQSPKPGGLYPPGSQVKITLGQPRAR